MNAELRALERMIPLPPKEKILTKDALQAFFTDPEYKSIHGLSERAITQLLAWKRAENGQRLLRSLSQDLMIPEQKMNVYQQMLDVIEDDEYAGKLLNLFEIEAEYYEPHQKPGVSVSDIREIKRSPDEMEMPDVELE